MRTSSSRAWLHAPLELLAQDRLSLRQESGGQRLKLDGDGVNLRLFGVKARLGGAGGVGGSGWEHANLLRAVGLGGPHTQGPTKPGRGNCWARSARRAGADLRPPCQPCYLYPGLARRVPARARLVPA